jgi:hypothetical protein
MAATFQPQDPSHKKLRPREKQRRANVKAYRESKTQNSEHKLSRNILRAEKMLDDVKELSKILRPFLTNGAILLGNNWDQIMEDQIHTALYGTIKRPMVDAQTGEIVPNEDGEPQYSFIPVEPKDQMAARKHLIETFPKLIPEEAKTFDRDPLLALAAELKNTGGKMALAVEVNAPEHEPDTEIIDGVARIIDNSDATIELDTANA